MFEFLALLFAFVFKVTFGLFGLVARVFSTVSVEPGEVYLKIPRRR